MLPESEAVVVSSRSRPRQTPSVPVEPLISPELEYTMIGTFLTRGLLMIFGYAYPAYECYKTVEKNKPDVEALRFWCQYWILVAILTVGERLGDAFISWLPMYSEAKLAFYIYLWFPKTKGTTYVYDSFFKPYVSKHETEIDRNLMELKIRAGDMAVSYFQKAATYGQTRVFDILQYVASQSSPTPRPPPNQPQQPGARPPRQPAANPKPQAKDPPSPTSSASSTQEPSSSRAPPEPEVSGNSLLKKTKSEPLGRSTMEADLMQIEPASSQHVEVSSNLPPEETVMEEAVRVTRGRLRKARSTAK